MKTILDIKKELLENVTKLHAPDGYLYAGVPRFQHLYGRDTGISSWQLLDIDPNIAKSTLEILATYQGKEVDNLREEEPGKIIHEHYVNQSPQDVIQDEVAALPKELKEEILRDSRRWRYPNYSSVDSTFWFLFLVSEYFYKTRDKDFIEKLWPHVERALEWIGEYGDVDKDGFIEYEMKNPYGLVHQGWKDVDVDRTISTNVAKAPIALVEAQGYYFLAYLKIAELLKVLKKDDGFYKDLERRASRLKEKFNQAFWMEHEQYFCFMLDGDKKQITEITSNPGHLLFTGVIEEEKVEKVVHRLFEKDMWTPYGIRTLSLFDKNFDPLSYHRGSVWPHDNWIIYKGLVKYGYDKEANMVKDALLFAYRTLDGIPELYGVKNDKLIPIDIASPIQAWATGALLNLLSEK